MVTQPTRTIGTRSANKYAHPGKPDLPVAQWPTDVVQAEKAAKAIKNSQRVATIQAGIQCAACIEDNLAMKVSNQAQRFKKLTLGLQKKAPQLPQNDDPCQEAVNDLKEVDVYKEETLVNGVSDCWLVNGRLTFIHTLSARWCLNS